MNFRLMSIGQLAQKTGCKGPTIRYYESIGLLAAPSRTEGGQRRYGDSHRVNLTFMGHARDLGFGIKSIHELLSLHDHSATEDGIKDKTLHRADDIAREHLLEVEHKISKLSALRDELRSMIDACHSGETRSCQVMSVLADHQLCHHRHGVEPQ